MIELRTMQEHDCGQLTIKWLAAGIGVGHLALYGNLHGLALGRSREAAIKIINKIFRIFESNRQTDRARIDSDSR